MPSPSVPPGGSRDRRSNLPSRPTALWWVLGALFILAIGQAYLLTPTGRQVPYSEFKSLINSGNRPQAIYFMCNKYLNAFLNVNGGAIYFGIMDDGIVNGLELAR